MHRRIVIILVAALFLTGLSCNRNVECPALSDDDFANFPYHAGDTLKFFNEQLGTKLLVVNEIHRSEAYSYACRDLNRICNCEQYAEALLQPTNDTTLFMSLKMLLQSTNNTCRFYYSLMGFQFEFDFENDAPYVYLMPDIFFEDNLVVSDSLFSNVYRIENTNFSVSNIHRVYFNRETGIIRFDEYIGGHIWVYEY